MCFFRVIERGDSDVDYVNLMQEILSDMSTGNTNKNANKNKGKNTAKKTTDSSEKEKKKKTSEKEEEGKLEVEGKEKDERRTSKIETNDSRWSTEDDDRLVIFVLWLFKNVFWCLYYT